MWHQTDLSKTDPAPPLLQHLSFLWQSLQSISKTLDSELWLLLKPDDWFAEKWQKENFSKILFHCSFCFFEDLLGLFTLMRKINISSDISRAVEYFFDGIPLPTKSWNIFPIILFPRQQIDIWSGSGTIISRFFKKRTAYATWKYCGVKRGIKQKCQTFIQNPPNSTI